MSDSFAVNDEFHHLSKGDSSENDEEYANSNLTETETHQLKPEIKIPDSECTVINGTHSPEMTNQSDASYAAASDDDSGELDKSKNPPENDLQDDMKNMAIQDQSSSSSANDSEHQYNHKELLEIYSENNGDALCPVNESEVDQNSDSVKQNAPSYVVKQRYQNSGKSSKGSLAKTNHTSFIKSTNENNDEQSSISADSNVKTNEKRNQEMKNLMHKNLEKFSPKKEAKPVHNKSLLPETNCHTTKATDRPRRVNPFNHVGSEETNSDIWQMQQPTPPSSTSLQAISTYDSEHPPSLENHYSASEHNFKSNHLFNSPVQHNYNYPYANDNHAQFDLMPPSSRVLPSAESPTYFEDVDAVVREAKSSRKHQQASMSDPWVKMDQNEHESEAITLHDTNIGGDYDQCQRPIGGDYHQTPSALPPASSSNSQREKKFSPSGSMERPLIEAAGPCLPQDLIEGVIFIAHYLGSTQLQSERNPGKNARMMQAQEAVGRIKAPEGESQPSVEVDLFISTDKVKVLNTVTQEAIMDHSLRSISYIADIGKLLVIMAKRRAPQSDNSQDEQQIVRDPKPQRSYRVICHVFSSIDAHVIAQAIGQAFNVAYQQFLTANGIEPQTLTRDDYNQLLDMQEMYHDDLVHYSKRENVKDLWVEKNKGEPLGVVIVESGWGSIVPTVILANLQHGGPAERCGKLSIGDQLMTVNGTSLVGLPLATCQSIIKGLRAQSIARLNIVSCPPVVTVLIKRPDLKYQLGFSVQDGIICSLMRGGIAERGGVRVGHRIIEINNQSVVATPHEKIVQTLVSSVGEIQMKTMPAMMYRLLTGQEQPVYI